MDPSSVKLVLEQLARLHAASHHYLDHFPDGGIDGFKRAHPLFINDRWLFSKSAGAKFNRTFFGGRILRLGSIRLLIKAFLFWSPFTP